MLLSSLSLIYVDRFSCDEGLTWTMKNFSVSDIYIYGVITEPGEQTTVFSIYGDYPGKREWVVIRVDIRSELGIDGFVTQFVQCSLWHVTLLIPGMNCTTKDYTVWHPSDERHDSGCLLGRDISFERRRRDHVCFNGENYDRGTSSVNCSCTREDYEW